MPSSAHDVIGFFPNHTGAACGHVPAPLSDAADADDVLCEVCDLPIDRQPRTRPAQRARAPLPAPRQDAPIDGQDRMRRRLALAMAGTTPTLLPELLRTFSQQAGHLASHPVNAFDNNPFIVREWLIVAQVLHAAAQTLENRFEALFLGL